MTSPWTAQTNLIQKYLQLHAFSKPVINKSIATASKAIEDIEDGSTVMIGGFGGSGLPENLIIALRDKGSKNLTIVANNVGGTQYGVGILINNRQVRRVICSFPIGRSSAKLQDSFWEQYDSGQIKVEVVPQGTLAERIRAGGAGISAFYVRAGIGTLMEEGKEQRIFEGQPHLLEYALKADYALLKAYKSDRWGNLTYRRAMRNFNAVMAAAARVTIVEVEKVVEVGELDPETIVTPSIYVDRLVEQARK
jgi:3-oxoadipate CoA-transferase, alpha subunit